MDSNIGGIRMGSGKSSERFLSEGIEKELFLGRETSHN